MLLYRCGVQQIGECVAKQRDPGRPATRSPKDFWKERFGRYNGEEKEGDKDKTAQGNEEKEEAVPPKKIESIGEETFWTSNRFGGN